MAAVEFPLRTKNKLAEPPTDANLVPQRVLTPAEQASFNRHFWEDVALERREVSEETLPWRARAAWRIVREMARLKNLVPEDGLLADMPLVHADWSQPTTLTLEPGETLTRHGRRFLMMLARSFDCVTQPPQPLLPPDPDSPGGPQGDLQRWLIAAQDIATFYRMGQMGCDVNGSTGLRPLLNPKTVHRAMPTQAEICLFEMGMVRHAMTLLNRGPIHAAQNLTQEYKLHEREVRSLLCMAAAEMRDLYDQPMDIRRAAMEHRIEGYVERAQEAMDLNSEMKALKALAAISGLTRTEPENADEDFLATTRRIAAQVIQENRPEIAVIDPPIG